MICIGTKTLYCRAAHHICSVGRLIDTIHCAGGFKQGRPLVGIIFVRVAEPLRMALRRRIPKPLGVICSYFDDIAMAVANLIFFSPLAVRTLREFQFVSSLVPNCYEVRGGPTMTLPP